MVAIISFSVVKIYKQNIITLLKEIKYLFTIQILL